MFHILTLARTGSTSGGGDANASTAVFEPNGSVALHLTLDGIWNNFIVPKEQIIPWRWMHIRSAKQISYPSQECPETRGLVDLSYTKGTGHKRYPPFDFTSLFRLRAEGCERIGRRVSTRINNKATIGGVANYGPRFNYISSSDYCCN